MPKFNNPRLLPSITSSAVQRYRENGSSHRSRHGTRSTNQRVGAKPSKRLNNLSNERKGNLRSHEQRQSSTNTHFATSRNLISGEAASSSSFNLASESAGSGLFQTRVDQMISDQYSRGTFPFVQPLSPPPPYSKPINMPTLYNDSKKRSEETAENMNRQLNSKGQSMYPSRGGMLFRKKFGRKGWKDVTKTSVVLPRKSTSSCCSAYLSTLKSIKNNWAIMLLVHSFLLVVLGGYIVIGASIFQDLDNGRRFAVTGDEELQRVAVLKKAASERLLNVSLKAVLEKSRDAVLDTIFTSDTLQAALSVFKTSRIAFLPADHKLELLSQNVLKSWEKSLEDQLTKYHFIASMEKAGFKLNKDQLSAVWGDAESGEVIWIQWTFGEAAVQSFCLMTTMGLNFRSPSDAGKAAVIIYAIMGAPLYWWIIFTWSRRLFDSLFALAIASNMAHRKKIGIEDARVQIPNWTYPPPYSAETSPFFMFLCSILTIAYVFGIGPLGCGSPTNSFGERLEAAFLALLVVCPPSPLPVGVESSIGFILYIVIGHVIGVTFLTALKRSFSQNINKVFSPQRRITA